MGKGLERETISLVLSQDQGARVGSGLLRSYMSEGARTVIKSIVSYITGPAPAKPGQVIGSAGPTTAGRCDVYAPRLIAAGLKGMIGKGNRTQAVKDAIKKYKAVYFGAIGGAGALIAKNIIKADIIAYEELGAEALRRLEVKDFAVTVINDIYGGDLYEEGKSKYRVG